ncbi:hypothetical protein [Tenacibaculum xiamenense]|uniref:hypothetical protein n=1 Tax=Tenacibaculum xiamenense TaxID=1261553 RepID=UPI00389668DB
MKTKICLITILLITFISNAQDLISGGSNSWIFHTPDGDGRSSLHIAPKINGAWAWGNQFEIRSDGTLARPLKVTNEGTFEGHLYLKNDIQFYGGNDWVIHTPGTSQGNLHFAPRINGSWNWDKQIYFTSAANLIVDGKIGVGSRNPDEMLTVKGSIHCEEVKIDLEVPADYVFQKYYTGNSILKEEYKMPTLKEVEEYTKKHHHLPEVPSARKIKEDGLRLKEMTNLLLQKIEELTLYTIEQEKRIKALEEKLSEKE